MSAPPCTLPDGVFVPLERRRGAHAMPLSKPVRQGERELREITFAACTGAHVRRAPESFQKVEGMFQLAGQFTGLADSVLDQVRGGDVGELIRATTSVAWPMIDLPAQWEAVWKAEAEEKGTAARALPVLEAPFDLALSRVYTAGEESRSKLVFGEMTGKLARAMPLDGVTVSQLPGLVEALTGAPRGIVDQLEGVDLNRALAAAQLFWLAIRGISATSG